MIWLIYNTLEAAQAALNYINSSTWFPADNGYTTQWCDQVRETTAGFGFPAIPGDRLDLNGVPQEEIDAFFSLHPTDLTVHSDELTFIIAA